MGILSALGIGRNRSATSDSTGSGTGNPSSNSSNLPGYSGAYTNPLSTFTGEKHGVIDYPQVSAYAYGKLRRNARGVYRNSAIAGGLVTRLEDTVINTGLTWESAPLWDLIGNRGDVPQTEEDRYEWTKRVETLWQLYHDSTDPDITGRETGGEMQRKAYRRESVDGEVFAILRYLNSPDRMSPVAIQFVRPESVVNPENAPVISAIKNRGGTIDHGVEYDSTGKVVAIHVRGDDLQVRRVAIFGPRSGRRFVIHSGNFEDFGQSRGLPPLSTVVYEVHKMTEYDIAELEAAVSQAAWLGAMEADTDARPGKGPQLRPNVSNKDAGDYQPKSGIEHTRLEKFSLILQHVEPGYKARWFQPTRPNQNFDSFQESFMNRIAGRFGMPVSVLRQRFQSSYSAARAELLTYWLAVDKKRAKFRDGFIRPWHEAWFSEAVRGGVIRAPGFESSRTVRRAWMAGSWNGVARPSVDPLKEVNAVEKRLELGHTTGEREAKAYNGSDYRENVNRLRTENALRAESTTSMQPPEEQGDIEPPDDTGDDDTEDNR